MIIVRAAAYRTVPWTNGGGSTREIFREPAEPAAFDWRLSLASIDSSGPFSAFDGYERILVLAGGAGIELDFGQQGRSRLTVVGQQVSFDGGWPTRCTLLQGPSTDLNLIVSRERMQSAGESLRLTQPHLVHATEWPETLICCISGATRLTNTAGQSGELQAVDVARCSPADGTVTCSPLGASPAQVFVAGLGPVSRQPV